MNPLKRFAGYFSISFEKLVGYASEVTGKPNEPPFTAWLNEKLVQAHNLHGPHFFPAPGVRPGTWIREQLSLLLGKTKTLSDEQFRTLCAESLAEYAKNPVARHEVVFNQLPRFGRSSLWESSSGPSKSFGSALAFGRFDN